MTLTFGGILEKLCPEYVEISNLVNGYILGSWSVTLCFGVTVTLTLKGHHLVEKREE